MYLTWSEVKHSLSLIITWADLPVLCSCHCMGKNVVPLVLPHIGVTALSFLLNLPWLLYCRLFQWITSHFSISIDCCTGTDWLLSDIFMFGQSLAKWSYSQHLEHLILSLFMLGLDFDLDLMSVLWCLLKLSENCLFLFPFMLLPKILLFLNFPLLPLLKFPFLKFCPNSGFSLYGDLLNLSLINTYFCFALLLYHYSYFYPDLSFNPDKLLIITVSLSIFTHYIRSVKWNISFTLTSTVLKCPEWCWSGFAYKLPVYQNSITCLYCLP